MKKNGKCNLGFIGCGQLMTNQHIQNTHRSKVNRIHTLCDIDEAKMREVAQKYPALKTTTNYKQLLADPEVQLVVIAMNPEKHAALAIEALKAGKDVYVEKPMGVSVQECREIGTVAKKLGRRVTTGFNRRFAPAFTDLKPFLTPREGGLTMFYRIADRERWQRADSDRILHELVHIFDIMSYFTDSDPISVYANRGAHHNDNIVTLTFADKSIGTILSTGRTEAIPKERCEIHWDWKAFEMEDFIEARYYHVPKAEVVRRYPGRRSDKSKNFDYVEQFGTEQGTEHLREVLREAAGLFDQHLSGKMSREEVIAKSRGYIVDKGWAQALDEMGLSILENRKPTNATSVDGSRSVIVALAAQASVQSGKVMTLDPKDWRI